MASQIIASEAGHAASPAAEDITLTAMKLLCSEPAERMSKKLRQLSVLLTGMHGNGQEWLEGFPAADREVIVWLCSDLADEANAAWGQINELAYPLTRPLLEGAAA